MAIWIVTLQQSGCQGDGNDGNDDNNGNNGNNGNDGNDHNDGNDVNDRLLPSVASSSHCCLPSGRSCLPPSSARSR